MVLTAMGKLLVAVEADNVTALELGEVKPVAQGTRGRWLTVVGSVTTAGEDAEEGMRWRGRGGGAGTDGCVAGK
jgi:hypothetical protein